MSHKRIHTTNYEQTKTQDQQRATSRDHRNIHNQQRTISRNTT